MKNAIPTFRELMSAYPRIAAIERAKCERPGETAVANALVGVRAVARDVFPNDWPVRRLTDLTRRRIDGYLADAAARGLAPLTVWTYVLSLRAVVARWTRPYYADMGWDVPPFDLPLCRRRSVRYRRPDRELLLRLRDWYDSLAARSDRRDWVVATLMLEFAMRNGDIRRLAWRNFRGRDDGVVLCYTPHKTRLTSGRTVGWPVHAEIWERLRAWRAQQAAPDDGTSVPRRGRPRKALPEDGLVVPYANEVFARLNRELRERRFFRAAKGCYELRKICIDHVYQRFGAEAASSISGDDIRTVTRYYADPSAVTIPRIRIVDLL